MFEFALGSEQIYACSMREKILELRAQGKTYAQIKEEVGCSLATIAYHCSPSQKEKGLVRTRATIARRRAAIGALKLDPCLDCGVSYPPHVMEFDHISDDKIMNVSKMLGRKKIEDVLAEIAKCELVCANCHRHRTWTRLQEKKSHE